MTKLSKTFGGKPSGTNLLARTAFVAIDVQREFCDPLHESKRGTAKTQDIAGRIGRFLPDIKKTGMLTVSTYFNTGNLGVESSCGGLYKTSHIDWQINLPKQHNSIFAETYISDSLKSVGCSNLVFCGFNAGACVRESVFDALSLGFDVTVLSDLIGQDRFGMAAGIEDVVKAQAMDDMLLAGAKIYSSGRFLGRVTAQQTLYNAPSPHP